MCAIELCMQSRWKPALTPDWRPPNGNGWNIEEIPMQIDVADNVRKAWAIRRRKPNKNGAWAVNEMAIFLHANGVAVPKEIRSLIEAQADFEWCGREPSRCHKKILLSAASRGQIPPADEKPAVHVAAKRVSSPIRVVKARGGCGSCGGGRVR